MTKRNEKLTEKHSIDLVSQAIDHHRLQAEFIILLEAGEEVTVQEILDNPSKYHEVPCAHPLDNEITGKSIIYCNQEKPIIHSFAHGGEIFLLGPEAEEANMVDWSTILRKFVLEFNETHAQVIVGGKHRIMRTVPSEIYPESRITYEFIKQEELRKIYAKDLIQVTERFKGKTITPIFKDKITAWAHHENSRAYIGGVVFAPNRELPDDYYNCWQGFAVEPVAGANIKIIKDHIELIICGGNRQLIEYFYNWLAYTFQYPDRQAGSALVLRGGKGTGKGSIGHFIRKIWGQHGIHISNFNHLVGKFNGHLTDVCFLFADEAFYSGDKQHEGVLKALITEPTVMIERKGLDSIPHQNYLKVFMVTNNDYAVPASKDERRYCVFDVTSDRIGDNNYFDDLHAACTDRSVQAAFLHEMLNRDITNFHPGTIPESQGLKHQRLASLSSVGKWLVDSFTQGYFSSSYINEYKWESEVSSANLYQSFIFWCNSQRLTQYEIVNQNAFGKYLAKIFIKKKLKGDVRGFHLGTLIDAVSKFEKYEKVDLGLETDDNPLDVKGFIYSKDKCESSQFNFRGNDEQTPLLRVIK